MSYGPYPSVAPNETVKTVIALVSGMTISEMLDNVRIAKEIFSNNYILDVNDHTNNIPIKFELSQNYPNPFNARTNIRYELPKASFVTLKVFNILGQEVATLVNEKREAGRYDVKFDGSMLSSGLYFYRLTTGDFVETKKLLLIR